MKTAESVKGSENMQSVAGEGRDSCCRSCQHGLEVRGYDELVCMPFLEMRDPDCGRNCEQYELKKQKVIQSAPHGFADNPNAANTGVRRG